MRRRPCFLVAEPENPEGLSTRKLVLETGKFNVVTAHSVDEMTAVLEDFPGVDCVVLHSQLVRNDINAVIQKLRQMSSKRCLWLLTTGHHIHPRADADVQLDSADPQGLLECARREFGDPRPHHGAAQRD